MTLTPNATLRCFRRHIVNQPSVFITHVQFSNVQPTSSLARSGVDSTENAGIHCLMSAGVVASESLPTITENTATLLSEAQKQDDHERDPFANLDDDEEELETDELLVEDL